jgi:hypothetical protein
MTTRLRLACTMALAMLVDASAVRAATTRQCSDPCLSSARAERKDCITSASGVFLDAVTGCIERDHQCVDACRTKRQDCRNATSLGADLARCDLERDAATLQCRASFPLAPRRLAICVGRAQVAGFRCRLAASRALRAELKDCRSGFSACADACGPGGPPDGADTCRAEGKTALRDALGECKVAHRATASACIDKDLGCVQDCAQTREGCRGVAKADLDDAIAACTATRNTAVAACEAANPGGGASLQACVDAALAAAFDCRDAAVEASLPSFSTCTATYVSCLRACPTVSETP